MNNGIKYLIIILNTVIRMVVIAIITRMGCSTESDQLIYITNMVFICQFFNTGILPMLCTANLEHQLPPAIVAMFGLSGDIRDFNLKWFTIVGDTIVGSMVFNVIFPIGMECFWFSYRSLFRWKDIVGTKEDHPTKSCTIQQYINKWQGPQFFIHYKYSSMMNITFISMVFGPSMPILFPVASASLFVLYFLETYMLFYVYRRPPVYDVTLNNHVLLKLQWAPFFLLAFGYWQLSNPALIGNYDTLNPIKIANQPEDFGHYWFTSFNMVYTLHETPAGILCYIAIFYFIFRQFTKLIMAVLGLLTNDGRRCCR